MRGLKLLSTISRKEYQFQRVEEYSLNGEPLEVGLHLSRLTQIRNGKHLFERFANFMPFAKMDPELSLGEGNTPLIKATDKLQQFTGIPNLLLKMECQNPTSSFKDRGSLASIFMAKEMGENVTATISTGNMGNSIAAYAARAGIKAIVFVPDFTPKEKIMAMSIHNPIIFKVSAPSYDVMKNTVLGLSEKHNLRIVSGNGPIRVEGYKLTAFEMFEQMGKYVPDYIAVPTSACGHIRGIFKGYYELVKAGISKRFPKMIIVQPKNNSPIVTAIKQNKDDVVPFNNFHTIAEALTTGNPMGGRELILKAKRFGWLAEDASEEEIIQAHEELGKSGHFVEPASATSLIAVKKLREAGKIEKDASVVLMITGSGLKDLTIFDTKKPNVIETNVQKIDSEIQQILNKP